MDSVLKDNFIEAVKLAQKSIFTGSILSVLLYVFAKNGEVRDFTLPVLGFVTSGKIGLLIVFMLYIATGCMLFFVLNRANKAFKAIKDPALKEALMLYPSFACGSWYTRLFACVIPIALFGTAMNAAFPDDFALVYFFVFFFSLPYLASAFIVLKPSA